MLLQPVALNTSDPDASHVLADATFDVSQYHPCQDELSVVVSVMYAATNTPEVLTDTVPVIVPIPDDLALIYGVMAFTDPAAYRAAMIEAAALVHIMDVLGV